MPERLTKLVVFVDPATKRDLEEIARAEERSMSSLVRLAVRHLAASADVLHTERAKGITNAVRQVTATKANR